jgi:hypothetical protein
LLERPKLVSRHKETGKLNVKGPERLGFPINVPGAKGAGQALRQPAYVKPLREGGDAYNEHANGGYASASERVFGTDRAGCYGGAAATRLFRLVLEITWSDGRVEFIGTFGLQSTARDWIEWDAPKFLWNMPMFRLAKA